MTRREKVALAISKTGTIPLIEAYRLTDAAITAFLEAAAEPDEDDGISWHMRPDEATEEMDDAGLDDPKASYCDRCMHSGHTRNSGWPGVIWNAMRAAAPEFKLDK